MVAGRAWWIAPWEYAAEALWWFRAGARGKAISLREPAFADEGQGYIPQRAAFVDPLLLASPTC